MKVKEESSFATMKFFCRRLWPYDEYTEYEAKQWGHFVLHVVTSEISLCLLIRLAPNLARITSISFLTLSRNLFETTLENKVASSSEP